MFFSADSADFQDAVQCSLFGEQLYYTDYRLHGGLL